MSGHCTAMTRSDTHTLTVNLQRATSPPTARQRTAFRLRSTAMWRALAAAAMVLFGACAANDDSPGDARAPTTEQRATTTTTPEQGFLAAIESQLDYSDPTFPQGAMDIATSACASLSAATVGPASDDAANDTPQTDASVTDDLIGLGLDLVMSAELPEGVTAVILTEGTGHFCPQHTTAVSRYLEARGLT